MHSRRPTKSPPWSRGLCPWPARTLRDLVHALLQKSRDDRKLTAADLADSLRRLHLEWASDLTTPTTSFPAPKRSRNWLALLGLLPVLLLAGLYVFRDRVWPAAPAQVHGGGGGPDVRPVSQGAGGAGGAGSATVPAPVARPVRVDGKLWVSADGKAPLSRIADALAEVRPGETIEIEGGTYQEPIVLNDPVRYAGIRIHGPGAVLSSDKGKWVVRIDGVPDVQIAGLTINARAGQRAILVAGACPGLTVEQCRLEAAHEDDQGGSLLHVAAGASGTEQKPIRLDDLTFRLAAVGLVCGDAAGPGPTRFVRVTRCRFIGPGPLSGIPIILMGEVQNILLAGNRLEGGQSPLNLLLPGPRLASEVRFEFNSLCGFDVPINPYDSHPNQGVRYDNNLLVDVARVPQDERRMEELSMWFAGNLWELSPDRQTPQTKLIAEMAKSVPLKSRDAADPAFLLPVDEERKVGHSRFAP